MVAECADLIGSLLRPAAVVDIVFALDRALGDVRWLAGGPPLPLVLKIETLEAVRNLPRLLVQAAGSLGPTAAMIARGDLAVELGHARLAEIQEEILWLCEAARIPVVWATQVLDDLVKDGLPEPRRDERRGDGPRRGMRNAQQGPNVAEGVAFLRDVLARMDRHRAKKFARFAPLKEWA